ncbi:hypothetical protein SVAN01_00054 [Stagonosporopsis vannaccii]|nr:hypothetical protein SVAN01_00054 [Stagonosporopsis vannaccii]
MAENPRPEWYDKHCYIMHTSEDEVKAYKKMHIGYNGEVGHGFYKDGVAQVAQDKTDNGDNEDDKGRVYKQ